MTRTQESRLRLAGCGMERREIPHYPPDRMPYIQKGASPDRVLAARVGGILIEVWEYKSSHATPYVRLIKESRRPTDKMKNAQVAPFQAIFSPMETLVVGAAIEEWKNLLAAGVKSTKTPCAVVQVDRLIIKLYNPTRGQSAYADFTFVGAEAKMQSVLLSPAEATLVAGTIGVIAPDRDSQPEK